jgi:hypothetical protein
MPNLPVANSEHALNLDDVGLSVNPQEAACFYGFAVFRQMTRPVKAMVPALAGGVVVWCAAVNGSVGVMRSSLAGGVRFYAFRTGVCSYSLFEFRNTAAKGSTGASQDVCPISETAVCPGE